MNDILRSFAILLACAVGLASIFGSRGNCRAAPPPGAPKPAPPPNVNIRLSPLPTPSFYRPSYRLGYAREPALSSQLRGYAELGLATADLELARAHVLQAQSQAMMTNAEAQQLLEFSRSQALDNLAKGANVFYQKRQLNDAYGEALRGGDKPKKPRRAAPPGHQAPQPAGPVVEPVAGRVLWPPVLTRDEFLEDRLLLDGLFSQRVRNGTFVSAEVRAAVGVMKARLKGKVRELPPSEYAVAKRFLDALVVEAQKPLPADGVATR